MSFSFFALIFVIACRCVNGVCNSGINGTGSCDCNSGFKGTACDESKLYEIMTVIIHASAAEHGRLSCSKCNELQTLLEIVATMCCTFNFFATYSLFKKHL